MSDLTEEISNALYKGLETVKKNYFENPPKPETPENPDEPEIPVGEVTLTEDEKKAVQAFAEQYKEKFAKLGVDYATFVAQLEEGYLNYKKNVAENPLTSPEVTDADFKAIQSFVKTLGVSDLTEEICNALYKGLEAVKKNYFQNPPKPEVPETPDEPEVPAEITLTEDEKKAVQAFIEQYKGTLGKYGIDVEALATKLEADYLNYKKSVAENPIKDPALTPEEEKAIQSYVKALGVEDLMEEFINVFSKGLATVKKGYMENPPKPEVPETPDEPENPDEPEEPVDEPLTDEEIAELFDAIIASKDYLAPHGDAIKEMFFEYKNAGGLETPDFTGAELRAIRMFIINLGLTAEQVNEFTAIYVETVTELKAGARPEVPETPAEPENPGSGSDKELTETERNLLNALIKENEMLGKFEKELEQKFIEYKASGALNKIEKPEVTPEEEKQITEFLKGLGIEGEMVEKATMSLVNKFRELKELYFKK